MAVTCGASMMMYVLPMMLGRTYDMQHNTVGIDIYDQADLDRSQQNPIPNTQVDSYYMTIEKSSEKRKFLGVSGDLALKISAGLVDIRGVGEYLKDTSKMDKSVEILIKMKFSTLLEEIDPDAKPLKYWQLLERESVGTHVVTSLLFGGEVFASVNFVAHKEEYLNEIKGEVNAALSKEGAFDIKATGKLESLAKNISSKARMEIDYFATVPLEKVPTSIEGLKLLVSDFKDQVLKINNGNGVAICVGIRALSEFKEEFRFTINEELQLAMEDFNYKFDNLREAKSALKSLISSLPENMSEDYLKKVVDFSNRVTSAIMEFHKVIGDLDLEKGSQQLEPALLAFDTNSPIPGENRYTTEMRRLKKEMDEKDDPEKPRGIYTRWGKRSCGPKASNILYIGFMSSFTEKGVGAGTEYQCLPENPDLKVDLDVTGEAGEESSLAAVRYKSLSVFKLEGKNVENKVASCTVCESFLRPTVKLFPASLTCPGDWVEEYTGFMVTSNRTRGRSEYICLDYDPDAYESSATIGILDPIVLPIKMGSKVVDKKVYTKDASLPCVVCSK